MAEEANKSAPVCEGISSAILSAINPLNKKLPENVTCRIFPSTITVTAAKNED
jgi:hypothetical protein